MKKVAIHSVPRSGSTWLGSIFDSSENVVYRFQPLFSYKFKGYLNESSSSEEINDFFQRIFSTNDDFILQKEAKINGRVPSFNKTKPTHLVYKEVRYHNILNNLLEKNKEILIIGLVRNPLAVINSWLKAPKEFRKDLGWKEDEEWKYSPKKNANRLEEFNGYEKWKEVAIMFDKLQSNYPDRFFLLRYEDLVCNTLDVISKLFGFCGLELTDSTINFIQESRTLKGEPNAYSVFRKDDTMKKWKTELSTKIKDEIINDLEYSFLNNYLDY